MSTMEAAIIPPKQLYYDLFLREADIGIYRSITLDAEGIGWNAGGIERRYRTTNFAPCGCG
jgi:hypothetical protein